MLTALILYPVLIRKYTHAGENCTSTFIIHGHLRTSERTGLQDFTGCDSSYGQPTCASMTQSRSLWHHLRDKPHTSSQEGGFWAAEKSWTFTGPNGLYKCPHVRIFKKKKDLEKNLSPTGRVDSRINSGKAANSICISHPIISGALPGTSTLIWSVILSTVGFCWLRAGVSSGELGLNT